MAVDLPLEALAPPLLDFDAAEPAVLRLFPAADEPLRALADFAFPLALEVALVDLVLELALVAFLAPLDFDAEEPARFAAELILVVVRPVELLLAEAVDLPRPAAFLDAGAALGFARLVGLLVAVAIFGAFIFDDFAIPVLVPSELPARLVVRALEELDPLLLVLLAVDFPRRTASLVPDADFTLPPPVITAEGFLLPPLALAVLLIGFLPGVTITASTLVFRVVTAFRVVAAFVPAIGLDLLTRIGVTTHYSQQEPCTN